MPPNIGMTNVFIVRETRTMALQESVTSTIRRGLVKTWLYLFRWESLLMSA